MSETDATIVARYYTLREQVANRLASGGEFTAAELTPAGTSMFVIGLLLEFLRKDGEADYVMGGKWKKKIIPQMPLTGM